MNEDEIQLKLQALSLVSTEMTIERRLEEATKIYNWLVEEN